MTFKVKDGLIVGNNTFVNATLDVNANNVTVSNTVFIGSGKVNSSFYTGTANNALYAFGKTERSINANSATYATNSQFAYTANVANYLNGKAESALAANSALYANYATYAGVANTSLYSYGGKAETALNANSATYATNAQFAYTSNVANYLNGKAESALAANSALYANYATYSGIANVALYSYGSLNANSATFATNAQFAYTANVANYLNGKAEIALNANSATYATNAQFAYTSNTANYLNGVAANALSTNSATYAVNAQFAYTANVANYLNGKAESALNANSALYANYATYSGIANVALYSYGGKAETALNANSATFATNAQFAYIANVANYLNGVAANALSTNSATYAVNAQFAYIANVANYLNGKAESALDANTAQYLGGFLPSYYTNATNISTGTLAEPRLPYRMDQNVRTTDSVQFGNLTVTGNVIFTFGNGSITSSQYSGTANNATYAYGKQEGQLSVANSVLALLANDSVFAYGKQQNQLSVANAVFAQTSNNALRFNGKQESQLSVSNAVFAQTANNALYFNGKQESQLSVANSLNSNNSTYLNGFTSSYFTNASNINTGTLPWTVLPPNSVNTSSSVTVSNTWSFQDIIINGGIKAANSFGNSNQILASNGSGGIYWKQDVGTLYTYQSVANTTFGVMRLRDANNVNNDVVLVGNGTATVSSNSTYVVVTTQDQFKGTVTSIDSGSGLVGGPITNNGTIYVGAGAGISVNQDDVAVNAKDGLVANSSGLFVNTAFFTLLTGTISANNASSLQFKTWESPGSIGSITPSNGNFIDLQANTLNIRGSAFVNNYLSISGTVINAVFFPATANNAGYAYGKQESQLNVNSSLYTSASNNANYLQTYAWGSPPAIGDVNANTGTFTFANVSSYVAFNTAAHMMAIGKIVVSGIVPANIIEFPLSTYTGGKIIIEVTDTHTNARHISELLLSHDNVNVSATEYGVVQTANTVLATFNTDILSGNVRILATPTSANTTTFKVIQNLFLA